MNELMNRRRLLRGLLATSAGAACGFRLPLAAAPRQGGKLLVSVQADGGWDPTSFCDPKTNVRGEPTINHWAERGAVEQAGNIAYAPFANNRAFFRKYHQRMLVINGVDAQTNSHTVGVVYNWSGRNSEGYPTLTALQAARDGTDLALPYLSFGGFSATGNTVRSTRLGDPDLLRNIAAPQVPAWDADRRFFNNDEWALLRARVAANAERLAASPNLLPAEARQRAHYKSAFEVDGLKAYADAISAAPQLEQVQEYTGGNRTYRSELRRQAQLAVLAFKTGVAVSADLWLDGFDTHSYHDGDHAWLLGNLTNAVDYLWEYAERHGVADRLVVVLGSDFGRTNRYNSEQGKDHWPVGSVVVMEKNQPWTNRVVGETDALHFAERIHPATLRPHADGAIIHPKHIHKALRMYLGLEHSPAAARFPFANVEDFPFFA